MCMCKQYAYIRHRHTFARGVFSLHRSLPEHVFLEEACRVCNNVFVFVFCVVLVCYGIVFAFMGEFAFVIGIKSKMEDDTITELFW